MSKENANPLSQTVKTMSDDEFENLFSDDSDDAATDKKTILSAKDNNDILDDLSNGSDDDATNSDDNAGDDDSENVDLDGIDNDSEDDDDDDADQKPINPLTSVLGKLAEKNVIQLFVDEEGKPLKPLAEYDEEELEDLIAQNIETAVMEASQNAPVQLFKQFPESVQKVISYTLSGGASDESKLQSLFLQLANMRKFAELNPENDDDAKQIIREYLQDEGVLSEDAIVDEVNRIADGNQLKVYAEKHKGILDSKQAQTLKNRLAQQEALKKQEDQLELKIIQSSKNALMKPELYGIPIPLGVREEVYYGLTKKVVNEKGMSVTEMDDLISKKLQGSPEEVESVVLAYSFLKDPNKLIQELTKKIKASVHLETLNDIKNGVTKGSSSATSGKAPKPKVERKLGNVPTGNIFSR